MVRKAAHAKAEQRRQHQQRRQQKYGGGDPAAGQRSAQAEERAQDKREVEENERQSGDPRLDAAAYRRAVGRRGEAGAVPLLLCVLPLLLSVMPSPFCNIPLLAGVVPPLPVPGPLFFTTASTPLSSGPLLFVITSEPLASGPPPDSQPAIKSSAATPAAAIAFAYRYLLTTAIHPPILVIRILTDVRRLKTLQ
ncbi:hypothetical protein [Gordoniibacillus kamchatkensis]|uniref:hypothetical protein n=1 Tax=Gordoniibacillus kamchatkensis TaxID=1590651 RepID=UPI000B2740B1|nr:hypothetical protein [Paenibacillus sp. VKM B-2647]